MSQILLLLKTHSKAHYVQQAYFREYIFKSGNTKYLLNNTQNFISTNKYLRMIDDI